LAAKLNTLALPGLYFRPAAFKPFYAGYQGKTCQGVQIYIQDPVKAPLMPITLYALDALRELHPERHIYQEPPKAKRRGFLSRLRRRRKQESAWAEWESVLGDPLIRQQLAGGRPVKEVLADWQRDDAEFLKAREKYLIYP
jgi:uncharacterized protein YbbC (DUF1343 family)